VRRRGGRGRGKWGWVSEQQQVLPGGRNSGQRAQKGPEKKNVCHKNLWPKINETFPELAELF
jgi:hypothetical protein